MKQLEDLDLMPFGKYKGLPMQEIPAQYLHWLWTTGLRNKTATDAVADYIQRNLHALKQEHPDGVWS